MAAAIMSHELSAEEKINDEELENLTTISSMLHHYRMKTDSEIIHFMFFNVIDLLLDKMRRQYKNAALNKLLTDNDDNKMTVGQWRRKYEMIWQRADVYYQTNTFISEMMRSVVMPVLYEGHYVLVLVCRYNERCTMVFDSLREGREICQIKTAALLKYLLLLEKFVMALEMLDMNLDETSQMSRQAVQPFLRRGVRGYGVRQETLECGMFVAAGMLRLACAHTPYMDKHDDLFLMPRMTQNEYISMLVSYIIFHRFFGYIRKMRIRNECEIVIMNVSPCHQEVELTSMIKTAIAAVIRRAETFFKDTAPIKFLDMNEKTVPSYEMRVRRVFVVVGSRDPKLGMTKLFNKELLKEYLDGSQIRLMVYPGQCLEAFERTVDVSSDLVSRQRFKIKGWYDTHVEPLGYVVPFWASLMKRQMDEMPEWSTSLVDHSEQTACYGLPPLTHRHVLTTVRTGSVPI